MDKRDARKLNQEAQHEIRRQAIKLHLKGFGPSKIAEDLEVHRNAVSGWINRYKVGGMKALRIGKRGPRLGTTLQLDEAAQNTIRKLLVEKNPDQLRHKGEFSG